VLGPPPSGAIGPTNVDSGALARGREAAAAKGGGEMGADQVGDPHLASLRAHPLLLFPVRSLPACWASYLAARVAKSHDRDVIVDHATLATIFSGSCYRGTVRRQLGPSTFKRRPALIPSYHRSLR
jgi:hypothetical protein